jgi:hypothetical protein
MRFSSLTVLVLVVVALAGCRREDVRVYTAPKDLSRAPASTDPHDHSETAAHPRPQMSWKLPEGWRETAPGQMSLAAFNIANGDAQVTITRLPALGGREAMIVNMWREQVGREPLSPEEAAKQLQDVSVGAEQGKLFEVTSTEERATRIVTAMVHRGEGSWFFKLSGDTKVVDGQKPAFMDFLKSISIKDTPAESAIATEPKKFAWQVPAGWTQAAPGQMQAARFTVGDGKADVFVSVFPNSTGGTLANVNRWRRQLGLNEVTEADLKSIASPLDPSTPDAVLVDMKNGGKRMLGAIVPRGEEWWFYKLLGEATAVGAEREHFIQFAKSKP